MCRCFDLQRVLALLASAQQHEFATQNRKQAAILKKLKQERVKAICKQNY
jgi:hypothetical protein